jgi:hypothetical protein
VHLTGRVARETPTVSPPWSGAHPRQAAAPKPTRAEPHPNDFGMIHAPVQPFFGNWLYWQAGALAPNVALWLRTLALPRALRRARGRRLRLAILNVAARLVRHGRRLPKRSCIRRHRWSDARSGPEVQRIRGGPNARSSSGVGSKHAHVTVRDRSYRPDRSQGWCCCAWSASRAFVNCFLR